MATGASTCDLAIILIDARHGVMTQTRRHSFIVSLLGIKHVLVGVNKMDLVDYSEEVYDRIKNDYREFAVRLDMVDQHFIPIAALKGDNLVAKSENMPWYDGSTLMHHLENVHIASDRNLIDFRFPVQFVNRPNLNFRGFCGTVASGRIRKGETVMTLPSRKTSRVKSIVTYDGELEEAFAPQSVTLTLTDEIDVSRGDMLVRPDNIPESADEFESTIVWMTDEPLTPGKQYWFKQGSRTAAGSISNLRYRIDVNTLHREPTPTLALNEIGRCHVRLNQPIAFDDYRRNRGTGAFIVIDRLTNVTVGAGMILDRTAAGTQDHWESEADANLQSEASQVTPAERAGRLGHQPATVLLTGLAGAGKTTTAYALERKLFDMGRAVCVLDGQNMRRGISRDLGFDIADRGENLRRSFEAARLFNEAGLICLAAFIAPEEDLRQKAAEVVGRDRFFVVHLDAPLEVCRARDDDGMYAKADSGEIANVPGVSAPYEPPQSPDLRLNTAELPVDECVKRIIKLLDERKIAAL
nr:adenylyl-sulfate kinase [Pirellulales bacterium]